MGTVVYILLTSNMFDLTQFIILYNAKSIGNYESFEPQKSSPMHKEIIKLYYERHFLSDFTFPMD